VRTIVISLVIFVAAILLALALARRSARAFMHGKRKRHPHHPAVYLRPEAQGRRSRKK
jgi:hypothetical protein